MHVITLLQTTAYIPQLSSRPFLATFIIACLALVNPMNGSQSLWGFQATPAAPAWFISPIALSIFGTLAVLEILEHNVTSIQPFLYEIKEITKAVIDNVRKAKID